MLQVIVPPSFLPERRYVLHVLLGEFLGLPYELATGASQDWIVRLESGRELVVRDRFFSRVSERESYLHPESIPEHVPRVRLPFTSEEDLPLLYGTAELEVGAERIVLGLDLFASAFFLLTRWEECVRPERDLHGRFPSALSLAVRCGFHRRPVVNEYVELLWNLLLRLGCSTPRAPRAYRFVLTHDVDFLRLWRTPGDRVRTLAGDLLKRRDPGRAWNSLLRMIDVRRGRALDPYDTFDWLMDVSERHGATSRFYWMSGGVTPHDNGYPLDGQALCLMREMVRRGHEIGFHPSYATCGDPALWQREKTALQDALSSSVREGRQHYLRFEVPGTWQIAHEAGLGVDSSIGWADTAGFRAGVCWEHPVFNVLTRQQLELRERPLIVMDLACLKKRERRMPAEQAWDEICALLEKCRRYRGDFVLLWHNSSLTTPEACSLYERVVQAAASSEPMNSTLQESVR